MAKLSENKLFLFAGFCVFSVFIINSGGAGCPGDDRYEEINNYESYTGGEGGSSTAPFLPATNEVAYTKDNEVYLLDITTNASRKLVNSFGGKEPLLASKGTIVTGLRTKGSSNSAVLWADTFEYEMNERGLSFGHSTVDPSGKAGYGLVSMKMEGDTHFRIYKTLPDTIDFHVMTDGTVDALAPSISPSGTNYAYARQVSGFRNEIYCDSTQHNTDAGTLVYSPPAGHSVGLPYWGRENGVDVIFFQLNYPDGNSAIAKCRPDGSFWSVTKATAGGGLNGSPVQVHNGRIVFHSFDSGNMDIWSMNSDGTDLKNHTNTPGVQEEMRLFFQS